jgi:hypothetical protein
MSGKSFTSWPWSKTGFLESFVAEAEAAIARGACAVARVFEVQRVKDLGACLAATTSQPAAVVHQSVSQSIVRLSDLVPFLS